MITATVPLSTREAALADAEGRLVLAGELYLEARAAGALTRQIRDHIREADIHYPRAQRALERTQRRLARTRH